jgi:hypothetical protein
MVSNADGSGEFAVMTVRRPRSFDERGVAWSPDGQSLACFAGEFLPEPNPAFRLVEVNLRHPAQRIISPQLWRPRARRCKPTVGRLDHCVRRVGSDGDKLGP